VYLDKSSPDLERAVSAATFRLGCAPVVNLFPKTADPIRLTHRQSEYRVVPDARAPRVHEVYSVDRVVATSADGTREELRPFYSFRHATRPDERQAFWHAMRRPAAEAADGARGAARDAGTEVYLTPVDLELRPSAPASPVTLHVSTTCTNSDAPARLPFGPGQPRLQLPDGGPVTVRCLTKPTPTLRPPAENGRLWRLVSQLTLNHASLANGPDALREILTLHDLAGSAAARARVSAVADVRARRVNGRIGGRVDGGFCRGLEVTVTFDERGFPDRGALLFATVLERFFAMCCSVNSFSQLVARTVQQEKELRRWEPRCGDKTLL
jgi:type VI secretion system protein ImpG